MNKQSGLNNSLDIIFVYVGSQNDLGVWKYFFKMTYQSLSEVSIM